MDKGDISLAADKVQALGRVQFQGRVLALGRVQFLGRVLAVGRVQTLDRVLAAGRVQTPQGAEMAWASVLVEVLLVLPVAVPVSLEEEVSV